MYKIKKLKKIKNSVDRVGENWYYSTCVEAETNETNMERYRSGHNEAVLKTVCPKGRVGSNPTLSASETIEYVFVLGIMEKYPSG